MNKDPGLNFGNYVPRQARAALVAAATTLALAASGCGGNGDAPVRAETVPTPSAPAPPAESSAPVLPNKQPQKSTLRPGDVSDIARVASASGIAEEDIQNLQIAAKKKMSGKEALVLGDNKDLDPAMADNFLNTLAATISFGRQGNTKDRTLLFPGYSQRQIAMGCRAPLAAEDSHFFIFDTTYSPPDVYAEDPKKEATVGFIYNTDDPAPFDMRLNAINYDQAVLAAIAVLRPRLTPDTDNAVKELLVAGFGKNEADGASKENRRAFLDEVVIHAVGMAVSAAKSGIPYDDYKAIVMRLNKEALSIGALTPIGQVPKASYEDFADQRYQRLTKPVSPPTAPPVPPATAGTAVTV